MYVRFRPSSQYFPPIHSLLSSHISHTNKLKQKTTIFNTFYIFIHSNQNNIDIFIPIHVLCDASIIYFTN